jgi:ParB family chromosome partitioning protein
MNPKSGLGRGLSALIGEEAVPTRGEARATHKLPVAFLKPNRFQPRKTFAAEDLHDLTESVREKGILQPILVRPLGADSYEIVAG